MINQEVQSKNVAWVLPRPKPDHYKGGMPLGAEKNLLDLAREILGDPNAKVLNLFCGMNTEGFRVDLNPEVKPDLLVDVHELTKYLMVKFKIILADPPYSDKETSELYGKGYPKLNYGKWTGEAAKLLEDGGLLIVYHKVMVGNPDPDHFRVVKRVFIGNRTWHTPRVAVYFQKVK